MKYIVQMDKLEDFSIQFTKYCKDELYVSLYNIEKIFNEIEWQSPNKEIYNNILIEKMKYLKDKMNKLYFFAYFYKYASNHFTEANNLVNNEFNQFITEYNNFIKEVDNLYE